MLMLHLAGKRPMEIFKELASVGVKKDFVYRTLRRYRNTGTVDTQQGRASNRTATGATNVKKVRDRLRYDPGRSIRKLAADLQISSASVHTILHRDLQKKAYKLQEQHRLTSKQKKTRLARANCFLSGGMMVSYSILCTVTSACLQLSKW